MPGGGGGILDWLQGILSGGGQQQMAAAGPIPPAPQGTQPQPVPPNVLAGNPLTRGTDWNAGLAGLGQLGQNLANQYQRRPLGQAAGPQGSVADVIARQQQLTRQTDQQAAYDRMVAQLPPSQRGIFAALGADRGAQLLGVAATRPTARPATDAEIAAGRVTRLGADGQPLPWMIDQNGALTLPPHDPRVLEGGAGASETGRLRAGGQVIPGVGYLPSPASAALLGVPGPRGAGPPGAMPMPPRPAVTQPGGPPAVPRSGPPLRADQSYTAADMLATDPTLSQAEAQTMADSANQATAAQPSTPMPQPPRAAEGGPPRAPSVPNPPPYQVSQFPQGGTLIGPAQPADTAGATAAAQDRVRYAREQLAPAIQGASAIMQGAQRLRTIANDPTMRMGPGGGVANYAAEWLRFVGADGLAARVQSPDFASLQGLSTQNLIQQIGGSLGTGISNADVRLIERQVPNPLQSRETFTRFVNLLESVASNNLVNSHAAYAGSMPGYSPQTDPVTIRTTRELQGIGVDPSILFKDPSRGVPNPRPAAGPPVPVPAPTAPASSPLPVTAAGTAIPGPAGTVGRAQPIPQPPGAPQGASGSLANPARPATPAARDALPPGAYYINPGDGQTYQRAPRSGPRSR